MIKESETMRACVHSVDVLVNVVKRHAIVDVRCSVVISVVIGICLFELSVPPCTILLFHLETVQL